MRCRRLTLSLAIWLAAGIGPVRGQDAPPAPALAAPPAAPVPLFPLPLPEGPTRPAPPTAARPPSDWSLGLTPPVLPDVAEDLYPPGQAPGWYAGAEIGILKPNLKSRLTTPAGTLGPTGAPIAVPGGGLDWTGAPELDLGYRFGKGAGQMQLAYRLAASSGRDALGAGPDPLSLTTRLNVETVDLDYISPEYVSDAADISRFFFRELRGGVGLRVASAFFDSKVTGGGLGTDTHASSSYTGVGLRMFSEIRRDLGRPDVQFYARLSANGIVGPIRQRFSQATVVAGGTEAAFFDTGNRNDGIGILRAEAGASWEPAPLERRLRLTAAYSWERWWNFGRTDDSNAELTLQGAVLRAEYRY